MEKKLSPMLAAILLLGITALLISSSPPVSAVSPVTTLFVDPSNITDPTLEPGSTFSVNVKITDVVNLYGYEFKLQYDTTLLTATQVIVGSFFEPGYTVWKNEINDDAGRVWLGVTQSQREPSGVSGSGTLAVITFIVDTSGESHFDLRDTKLGDPGAQPIPHNVIGAHDIAVSSIQVFPSSVIQGDPVYIIVNVENQGSFTETFTVSLYSERNVGDMHFFIGKQTVTLDTSASKALTFVWDTTDVPYGTYYFNAEASVVPNEFDTADNILTHGAKIAGICAPPIHRDVNILALLSPIVGAVFSVLSLGIGGIIFLRTLASGNLTVPFHLTKKSQRS